MYGFLFNIIFTFSVLSLSCVIIILLVLLLRATVFKNSSGDVRYYLWLPVILLALIPLRISLPQAEYQSAPSVTQTVEADVPRAEEKAPSAVLPSYSEQLVGEADTENKLTFRAVLNEAADSVELFIKGNAKILTAGLFLIWFIGFVITTTKSFVSYIKTVKHLNSNSAPASLKHMLLMDMYAQEVGVKQKIRLRIVQDGHILSPCLAGLIHPTVYVSESDMKREDGELRLIFIHELVHIKRQDVLYGAFSGIICALHWFNPLFKVLSRLRYEDCELSCDEKVLSITGKAHSRQYINMIFDMLSSGGTSSLTAVKTPEIALFFENGRDINFIKRRFINMKKQNRKGTALAAVAFALTAVVFSAFFVSSCGVPETQGILSSRTSRFDNPILEQAVYEYYGLDRNDEITDEQLNGIKSINMDFISMPNRLSTDGSDTSVFADISVNGVRLGLLPEYVSRDRFENIIKPSLNELDKNYTNRPNYNMILAYYLLVDKNDAIWTDDDNLFTNLDKLNEFLTTFPILNQTPVLVLDQTASEREKQKLITILNAAGLCDEVIVEDNFSLSDMELFVNFEKLTINGEEKPLSDSIIKSDFNAQSYALTDIQTDTVSNPLFNYPTVEPKEREELTGDNYYIPMTNLSLQSALLEYFMLDQGQTSEELTKEHLDLITSIKITVDKGATNLINAEDGEINKNAYYLVYEINGQSMGILAPRINRGYFESHFVHYADSEESQQKLLAFYKVIDPVLLEHEREKAELLAKYPDSKDNPFYLLDPKATQKELFYLLDIMSPSPMTSRHTWQKETPYDTSDLDLFVNLETFELDEALK